MLFYRVLGKRVVLTAHNVNAAKRDSTGQLAQPPAHLRIQYRLCHHVFVHTERHEAELVAFGVRRERVSVIPFGINNTIPTTGD